jgi:hypothetical protein
MTDNKARGTLLWKNSRKSLQSFPCSLLADNPRSPSLDAKLFAVSPQSDPKAFSDGPIDSLPGTFSKRQVLK